MKIVHAILAHFVLACFAACLLAGSAQASGGLIEIATFIEHPALDQAMKGVVDGLHEEGITEANGYKIETQSAQGSPVTAGQIARKFAGDRPNVIVAISTPVAQSMVATIHDIPIIFTAVTDPLAAKVVGSLAHPGGNATGSADSPPLAPLLGLIDKLSPGLTAIGFVYNAGEANSRAQIDAFKQATAGKGWRYVEATVQRPTDVQGALQSLAGKVQAIYVPNDNTVVATFEIVQRFSVESKIPVYCTDTLSVNRGALAAVGIDYYKSGRAAATMVKQVLNGAKPADMPVFIPNDPDLAINRKIAKAIGITIPPDVAAEAKRFVD
jgi:putative ABC transport system substrate-binding protein